MVEEEEAAEEFEEEEITTHFGVTEPLTGHFTTAHLLSSSLSNLN